MVGRRSPRALPALGAALLAGGLLVAPVHRAFLVPRASSATGSWADRVARPRAEVLRRAEPKDSEPWLLPTVDKDVDGFHKGQAAAYAWVQTSETMYIFAPLPPRPEGDDDSPDVKLSVTNEGWDVSLTAYGDTVLQGRLAHAVKPGTEVWMIEESRDGREYIVVEVDKLLAGMEWTSVLMPEVSFPGDYSRPHVKLSQISAEAQAATVEATLGHLQRQKGQLQAAPADHAAEPGNILTVDIQGYEIGPDGGRGAPMEVGSAEGMKFELGSRESGLMPQMHEALVGIVAGEARDVELTLGQRAGGQRIICAVTCQALHQQVLPALDDDFARAVKRDELFRQAGTEQGISEEEEDTAETFTMEELRQEIAGEVSYRSQEEIDMSVKAQLEETLRSASKVDCEWGDFGSSDKDPAVMKQEEEFAAVVRSVAQREGLLALIDEDLVNRQTWHVLGTPKAGQTMAEVGDDPAREFQTERRKVQRRHELEQVTEWLKERMEVSELTE